MKKILRNEKGSSLIFVLILLLVAMIMIGAVLLMVLSFANKGEYQRQDSQAYYTAKSACDAIASKMLERPTDGTLENPFVKVVSSKLTSDGTKLTLSALNFNDPELEAETETKIGTEMGKVDSATIERKNELQYVITCTATAGGSTETMKLIMYKRKYAIVDLENGFEGFYFSNVDQHSNVSVSPDSDMVVTGDFMLTGKGNIEVGKNLILGDPEKVVGSSALEVSQYLYTPDGTFLVSGNGSLRLQDKFYDKRTGLICGVCDTALTCSHNHGWPSVIDKNIRPISDLEYSEVINNPLVPNWATVPAGTTGIPAVGPLNKGQYYYASGTINLNNLLLNSEITPYEPVFIVVRAGTSLSVSGTLDPQYNPVKPNGARVFFVLEGNGQLAINAPSTVAVYGGKETTVSIYGNGEIYGQIQSGNIYTENKADVKLNFTPIVKGLDPDGGTSQSSLWKKEGFER